MTLMDRRPDVILTVRCATTFFSLGLSLRKSLFIHLVISPQGRDMTLIHMAPQVPLPDRINQARIQLVEVKYDSFGREEKPTVGFTHFRALPVTRRKFLYSLAHYEIKLML